MEPITIDQVIAKVREIADRNAAHVYKAGGHGACLYWEDGEPSCIFGHVFSELGVPDTAVERYDESGRGLPAILRELCDLRHSEEDSKIRWCRRVQGFQDAYVPWGQAVIAANEIFPFI